MRTIALVSMIYDISVGVLLTVFRDQLTTVFGVPAAVPPIHVDLNAVFVTAVGLGYWLPYRDPQRYRGYLWVMGPVLKGAGAATFILDYLMRSSPASMLLFAASDGALALATLIVLLKHPARR